MIAIFFLVEKSGTVETVFHGFWFVMYRFSCNVGMAITRSLTKTY